MSTPSIYLLTWHLLGYGLFATGRREFGVGAFVIGFVMMVLEKVWS